MLDNPYVILGVTEMSSDADIRKRYLELVREYSPERHPQKFATIRAAYDAVKDLHRRVRHRLFEQGRYESIDLLIEEIQCRTPRRRHSLESLQENWRKAQ